MDLAVVVLLDFRWCGGCCAVGDGDGCCAVVVRLLLLFFCYEIDFWTSCDCDCGGSGGWFWLWTCDGGWVW